MQSPTYNALYAKSIPALSTELLPILSQPAAVLDLLLKNEENDFGSAAWFLTTQCTKDVRTALQSGSEQGWEQYISTCVGTTATGDRKAVWQRAVKALGV
jgi:hypothetical protein